MKFDEKMRKIQHPMRSISKNHLLFWGVQKPLVFWESLNDSWFFQDTKHARRQGFGSAPKRLENPESCGWQQGGTDSIQGVPPQPRSPLKGSVLEENSS